MNQPNIPTLMIDDYPNKKCACGGEIYNQSFLVREIPPLVVGNQLPVPIIIPVIVCAKCGQPRYAVPSDNLPAVVPYKKPELN